VRFRFEVDGREHAVDVERTGGPWIVTLGGRRWSAQMHPSGRGWSLLLAAAGGDGAGPVVASSFDVRLGWPGSDRADVVVDGVPISVTVAQVLGARRSGAAADHRTADGAVRAPMAGRVVRVLVSRGEAVAGRQGVIVVEAMKMENELRAPRPGVVKAVHVSAGAPVNAGQLLVELDS
jgi:biotin carboxyl carrier protein